MLFLLIVLAFIGCKAPDASAVFDVSVNVTSDIFHEKTIGFNGSLSDDGTADVSHYMVYLYEGTSSAGEAYITSEYLQADRLYRINDITTGDYTFVVGGFIKLQDGTFHKIAKSSAQTFRLSPSNNKVNVTLDGLLEESSGAITVSVTLPDDFIDASGNYNGKLNWRITSMTDMSTPVDQGTVDKDTINGAKSGKVYTMTVDSQTAGVYMLFVDAVNDTESDTKSNADVLRLLPGLAATGEMDLNSLAVNAFDFTITDKIGTELKPVTSDDKTSYPSTDGTVVITLKEAVGENIKVFWFIDGKSIEPGYEGLSYTFSELVKGIHNLVGIFWDTDKEISAGSLDVVIDVQREALIEEKPIYDFELNDDEESYTVTGFSKDYINNYPTEITIPSEYQGKPVTRIEDNAFYGCEFVDISIPCSINYIGEYAFQSCSSLKNVTFEENSKLPYINQYVFWNCIALQSINIPDSVTVIAENAFDSCESLTEVKFGTNSQLKTIGYNVFYCCSSLEHIFIPKGVSKIGSSTFGHGNLYLSFYCESDSQPDGWEEGWDWTSESDATQVFWGVSKAVYDSIVAGTFDVSDPVISPAEDGKISITSDTSFAYIYYTTDGSVPTAETGTRYEAPFAVDDGITVKAVAYVGMGIYSDVAERTIRNIYTFALNPDGQSYEVTGFIEGVTAEEKEHLVIPGTYQGLPVTSIGKNAFENESYKNGAGENANVIKLRH